MYEAMNAADIGKRIQNMRKQRKLTAEDLGKALNISSSAVNMYESGQRIPRDEVKIKIADFFGIPVETIFYVQK